jgi:hypothetical protein
MISCFVIQSREFVTLCQLVHCDLFQLAEVSLIMVREMKEIRHDSSDFASSDSDKSDWDAVTGCISNPNSVDFNDNVVAAMSGHAVVGDSNDETKKKYL